MERYIDIHLIICYNQSIKGGDFVEIYSFYSTINLLMNLIYAIGAVGLAVLLVFIVRFFILQIIAYKRSDLRFPIRLTVFFSGLIVIPLIGSLGLGNSFVQSMTYETDMRSGNALYLTGDVELVSCEEFFYRGNFHGYDVELKMGEEIISPSNTFPPDVVEYFTSDQKLVIQYGIIDGDGLYVWSIKAVEDN